MLPSPTVCRSAEHAPDNQIKSPARRRFKSASPMRALRAPTVGSARIRRLPHGLLRRSRPSNSRRSKALHALDQGQEPERARSNAQLRMTATGPAGGPAAGAGPCAGGTEVQGADETVIGGQSSAGGDHKGRCLSYPITDHRSPAADIAHASACRPEVDEGHVRDPLLHIGGQHKFRPPDIA